MIDNKLRKLANILIKHSLEIKKNDYFMISGGINATPLIKEVLNCEQFKNYTWEFENLVIEGAGTNGTVTVGSYKILETVGILSKMHQFIGSSSGSIMAAFAAVKMPSSIVERVMISFDMNKIRDDSFGIFRDMSRITNQYGYYKGDKLEEFVENALYDHTGISRITFQQILEKYGTKLYITRANVSKLRTEYLCASSYPNMSVSEAVRQSGSIPLVFKAPVTDSGDIITDGALSAPYPINFFDDVLSYNKKTIGIKIMDTSLERRNILIRQRLGYDINDLSGFLEALITFQMVMIERLAIKAGYWERTITLESPGRRVSDFNVTLREKLNEIHQGAADTVVALARYVDSGRF